MPYSYHTWGADMVHVLMSSKLGYHCDSYIAYVGHTRRVCLVRDLRATKLYTTQPPPHRVAIAAYNPSQIWCSGAFITTRAQPIRRSLMCTCMVTMVTRAVFVYFQHGQTRHCATHNSQPSAVLCPLDNHISTVQNLL